MSLYVGNLHAECDDAVLYKKFSPIGKLLSVKVCRDSRTAESLGYGYVNFADPEDAKRAVDEMNYDSLLGQAIRIMWASQKPSTLHRAANLVVKNLDPKTDEPSVREVFCTFGEVISVRVAKNSRGESKGYGFVQFSTDEAADRAISALDNEELNGRRLSVSRFIPAEERRRYQQESFPNNIFVSNLTGASSEDLARICESFGDVVSARIVRDVDGRSKGVGFVSFRERHCAETAVRALNRLCLDGRRLSSDFVRNKNLHKE